MQSMHAWWNRWLIWLYSGRLNVEGPKAPGQSWALWACACSSIRQSCPIGKIHQKKKNTKITTSNYAFKWQPQMIGKFSFGRPMSTKTPLCRAELLTGDVSLENLLPNLKCSDLFSMTKINEHPSLFDKTTLSDDECSLKLWLGCWSMWTWNVRAL